MPIVLANTIQLVLATELASASRKAIMPIVLANAIQPVWDLLSTISPLFHYTFMQNAFLAGTLIAIIAGVMGYFAVLRHQSFASHSLASVGFAGATGAALFGISPVIGLFLAGIIAACGMQALNLATGEQRHNDVAVGAIFTASLALGFLFIYLSPTEFAGSVYAVLFGNVLGISDADVSVIAWSTLALGGCMSFMARPLFFASIDPDVATARGVPVRALGFAYLVLLAVAVAVAVQVVGVLLIFALLITPAAIAQNITTRPGIAITLAVALALIFLWAGLTMSYFTPYPVGFFITTIAFGAYLIVRGTHIISHRIMQRHIEATPEIHTRGTA